MSKNFSRRRLLAGAASGAVVAGSPLLGALAHAQAKGVTLDQIRAQGELRIGVEAAYVPFTFRREGKIVGYDVELAEIFCKTLGVKPTFIDTAWAGVIPSLYAKKFDIIMSAMSYTAERVKRVGFTIPYAEASQALLIRASDEQKIRGADDLAGRVIGVKLGSPGQILQERLAEKIKAAKGQGYKEVRIFDDHPAAYIALAQNRVDAVFNTVPTLAMVLKDAPGKYSMVQGIGADNWAGIAARTEDTEIIQFINGELKRMKSDDSLYRLQDKWFGFRMKLAEGVPSFGG